jgi:hypothetical protein
LLLNFFLLVLHLFFCSSFLPHPSLPTYLILHFLILPSFFFFLYASLLLFLLLLQCPEPQIVCSGLEKVKYKTYINTKVMIRTKILETILQYVLEATAAKATTCTRISHTEKRGAGERIRRLDERHGDKNPGTVTRCDGEIVLGPLPEI